MNTNKSKIKFYDGGADTTIMLDIHVVIHTYRCFKEQYLSFDDFCQYHQLSEEAIKRIKAELAEGELQ